MTTATQGTPTEGTATDLPRLLPHSGRQPEDWHAHAARNGRLPYRDAPGRLIQELQAAGLTGRGGAAFPVHRKLAAVQEAAQQRRRPAVVIAVIWRLSAASRDVPRAERVGLLMAAVHDRTALKDKLTGRGTASAQERISRR